MKILNLNHCDITYIPEEIGNLNDLNELHLAKNNYYETRYLLYEKNNCNQVIARVEDGVNKTTLVPSDYVYCINGAKEREQWIDMINNGPALEIPSTIQNLTKLCLLDIRYHYTEGIPNELLQLTSRFQPFKNVRSKKCRNLDGI